MALKMKAENKRESECRHVRHTAAPLGIPPHGTGSARRGVLLHLSTVLPHSATGTWRHRSAAAGTAAPPTSHSRRYIFYLLLYRRFTL